MEKQSKSMAPKEYGELPNDERCTKCWQKLGEFEDMYGRVSKWCANCQIFYKRKDTE